MKSSLAIDKFGQPKSMSHLYRQVQGKYKTGICEKCIY